MLAAATVAEELAYFTPGAASALYDGQALLVGRTRSFATSEPEASTDLSRLR
jgi:hypothetical protein